MVIGIIIIFLLAYIKYIYDICQKAEFIMDSVFNGPYMNYTECVLKYPVDAQYQAYINGVNKWRR